MHKDVHVVTQLMLSLLGLIVFPMETHAKKLFANRPFTGGWFGSEPIWKITMGQSKNLDDHMWHLRNAIAHNHVRFSSESRRIEKVAIEFADHKNKNPLSYWKAEIEAQHLRKFCVGLTNTIRAL